MRTIIGETERELGCVQNRITRQSLVQSAMDEVPGKQIRAAELLGIPRTTLQSKLARLIVPESTAYASAAKADTSAGNPGYD